MNFSFPYAGPQHGTLTLRTHPRYGKNVIFNIERGQIPCPAVSYSAAGPEDNSTEKAKTVRISVNVFQEGSPVFEFDVSGFDANKYKPK